MEANQKQQTSRLKRKKLRAEERQVLELKHQGQIRMNEVKLSLPGYFLNEILEPGIKRKS